ARAVHADTRRLVYPALRFAVVDDVEVRRRQRLAIEVAVDLERAAQQAGTAAASDARTWFQGPGQHRLRHTGLAGHEVQAVVHAVGEVDVGMSRVPEHR